MKQSIKKSSIGIKDARTGKPVRNFDEFMINPDLEIEISGFTL